MGLFDNAGPGSGGYMTPDDRTMLLLMSGLGMLGARGVNPLQALGQGGMLGMQAAFENATNRRRDALLQSEAEGRSLQNQQLKQQMADQVAMREAATSSVTPSMPALPPMGPPTAGGEMQGAVPSQAPGFDLPGFISKVFQQNPVMAMQLQKSMQSKFDTTPRIAKDANGKPYLYVLDEQGNERRLQGTPPPELMTVPLGGTTQILDRLTTVPGTTLAATIPPADAARLPFEAAQAAAAATNARTAATRLGWEMTQPKPLPGQTATDQAFAKEYVDFKAAGGIADVNKQLAQLRQAADMVEKEKLSGPVIGSMPDAMLATSETGQKAMQARDAVLEVAQRNLRLVLGAQFTQKEGQMLLDRTYNPRLPPEDNAARINRLANQIEQAAKAKQDASNYFEKNGTLVGWQGKLYSLNDFAQELPAPTAPQRPATAADATTVILPNGKPMRFPSAAAAAAYRKQVGL